MRSESVLLAGLAARLALANPEVTPAAVLPRQAPLDSAVSTCSGDADVQDTWANCAGYVQSLQIQNCISATASGPYATCACNFANNIIQCATSFCDSGNWDFYTDQYSASLTYCFSMGITPTPFTYTGQSVSGSEPAGTASAGAGAGAGAGGGATTTPGSTGGGAGTAPTTTASSSASKNAGAGAATPPGLLVLGGEAAVLVGFVLAWGVGFAGMLVL